MRNPSGAAITRSHLFFLLSLLRRHRLHPRRVISEGWSGARRGVRPGSRPRGRDRAPSPDLLPPGVFLIYRLHFGPSSALARLSAELSRSADATTSQGGGEPMRIPHQRPALATICPCETSPLGCWSSAVPFWLAADCGRESDPECGELVDTGWCDGNVAHNCNSWGEHDRSELPTG